MTQTNTNAEHCWNERHKRCVPLSIIVWQFSFKYWFWPTFHSQRLIYTSFDFKGKKIIDKFIGRNWMLLSMFSPGNKTANSLNDQRHMHIHNHRMLIPNAHIHKHMLTLNMYCLTLGIWCDSIVSLFVRWKLYAFE